MNPVMKYTIIISIILNLSFLTIAFIFIKHKGGLQYLLLTVTNMVSSGKVSFSNVSTQKEKYESFPKTSRDIIFLGDSLIYQGDWAEYFPGEYIRNRGIGGDKSSDIINRLDSILEGKPSKIILMVGINDIITHYDLNETVKNIKNIIMRIKKYTPNTTFYILSVLPININIAKDKYSKMLNVPITFKNQDVIKLDDRIQAITEETNTTYINIYNNFIDSEGQLKDEYTTDGIHLSDKGYITLANLIERIVK